MSNGAFMITNNMKTKITNIIRFEYGLLNSKVNGHVIIDHVDAHICTSCLAFLVKLQTNLKTQFVNAILTLLSFEKLNLASTRRI